MGLRQRLPDVRAAAQLARVKSRDRHGRVREVHVPGHQVYRKILIKRVTDKPYPHLAAECLLITPIDLVPCDGNGPWRNRYASGSACCYHAMAGAERAVENSGVRIIGWFDNEADMIRSRNLKQFDGSSPGHLYARNGGKNYPGAWFLWRAKQ